MKPHLAPKPGPKTYHGVVIAFLLVQLLIIVRNWVTDYWLFYWFCDFAPPIFVLCFALGNIQTAKGLMYIGLVGQLIYAISFFSPLLFHVPFLGIEIPVVDSPLDGTITAIMHVTIPHYTLFWIPLVFLFVVLPTYWCDRKIYSIRKLA